MKYKKKYKKREVIRKFNHFSFLKIFNIFFISIRININQNEAINTNKSNINVLSSRMDTFTALEDGSTTGDAELQDIRVRYDGTTYSTAGNAVREQISDVNTNLVRYTNSKAYINGNTFRLLPVSGNGFAYAYFNRNSIAFDLLSYNPANCWFIIGECINGCIAMNAEGVFTIFHMIVRH